MATARRLQGRALPAMRQRARSREAQLAAPVTGCRAAAELGNTDLRPLSPSGRRKQLRAAGRLPMRTCSPKPRFE